MAAFNNYRKRVERFELACQHQSAISSLHIKLTLDPENSSKDGTADKLLALIFQENAHFVNLIQEEHIPDGESLEFGDLTEFEVASADDSEFYVKID